MTYPLKNIGLNRNRKIIAVANPSADITQMVATAVPGVADNYRGVWDTSGTYTKGEMVLYSNVVWLCLASTTTATPATGSTVWQAIGSYSAFLGAWSSSTAYVVGDEVTYGGNFYFCTTANTNQTPSTSSSYWQVAGPTSLDNVADGTTYTRTQGAVQTNNVPDLNKGILGKHLGNIADDLSGSGRSAHVVGILANRPAFGTTGRTYLATDAGTQGITYRDTGAAWVEAGVGHLADINGNLDNVGDGTTYLRPTGVNASHQIGFKSLVGDTSGDNSTSLVDAANKRFLHTTMSTPTLQTIVATADLNGNYLGSGSTTVLVDDAGLGTTAAWGSVSQIPDTLTGHNLQGIAQPQLPPTSGTKHIWASDSGGAAYETQIYGSEINIGSLAGASATLSNTAVTMTNVMGGDLIIPNPGQPVTILVFFKGSLYEDYNGLYEGLGKFKYSTNGGSTWSTSEYQYCYVATNSGNVQAVPCNDQIFLSVNPTGDIHIQYIYGPNTTVSGSNEILNPVLSAIVIPNANMYTGGTLSASLPSTATMSGSVTYPGTLATANKSLSVTYNGGVRPITFSNAIVSGGTSTDASISSGATSQTFTVSDTETATSGGASFTTNVHSVVTDSTTPTAQQVTTNTCTITGTFTQTGDPLSASMSTTGGSCSTGESGGSCNATGTFSITASGGGGAYSYSNSITSQTSGYSATITSGATSSSGNVSGTAPTVPFPGAKNTVNLKSVVSESGYSNVSATGSLGLTYKNYV